MPQLGERQNTSGNERAEDEGWASARVDDVKRLGLGEIYRQVIAAQIEDGKAMKFVVYKSKKEWRWRLLARNGKIIASGEGFKTRRSCDNSIVCVRTSMTAKLVDQTEASKPATTRRRQKS